MEKVLKNIPEGHSGRTITRLEQKLWRAGSSLKGESMSCLVLCPRPHPSAQCAGLLPQCLALCMWEEKGWKWGSDRRLRADLGCSLAIQDQGTSRFGVWWQLLPGSDVSSLCVLTRWNFLSQILFPDWPLPCLSRSIPQRDKSCCRRRDDCVIHSFENSIYPAGKAATVSRRHLYEFNKRVFRSSQALGILEKVHVPWISI